MCYPPGARPPDVPSDVLPPMSGGSGAVDVTLASADGTKFRAYLARAGDGDAGVVIAPDVRGLHSFYEELAERFASAGVHAIAFDYFGRTAGMDRRGDDFDYMPHVRQATPRTVFADIAASAILRSPMVRASGPDTAEICGPIVRSGNAALKAAIRPTVGRRP